MKAEGNFTQELWQAIEPLYDDLLKHPFVKLLAEAKLSKSSFAHYLSQDILYLKDDNTALEILSTKVLKQQEKNFFKKMAEEGLAIEHALHDEFLAFFKVKEASEKSPAIKTYTSFLLDHARNSSVEVTASALLPCFWVYFMVGKEIIQTNVENNPYQKWIDTYGGDEFASYVKEFISIVENMSSDSDQETKEEMKNAFICATEYELEFFEESYRKGL